MSLLQNDWLVWWLLPLSGSTTHEQLVGVAWHGRIMVLCWGMALPLGVMAARFFKVMPGQEWPRELDNTSWWKTHLYGQGAAVVLALFGVALMWNSTQGATLSARLHAYMGWVVTSLGALQALTGLARGSKGGPTDLTLRGDHYDMTAHRNAFEWTHKLLGYLVLLLAFGTVLLGLWVADAPRWMLLAIGMWWLVLVAAFVWLQRRGLCMDTYQAIWGPDAQHPGNRVGPIGWGIKRYGAESFAQQFRKVKGKK